MKQNYKRYSMYRWRENVKMDVKIVSTHDKQIRNSQMNPILCLSTHFNDTQNDASEGSTFAVL
jgi:hypothetical protein